MEVLLTAVSPDGSGAPVDLAVRAPEGCTAGQLWPALCQATGHDPCGSARLFVDGSPVPNDALLGSPPLVDGAVLSLGTAGMTSPRRVPGVLELHVVAGPDSGQVLRLAPGAHLVGRAAEAGLRLDDADISRVHAQLDVTSGRVTVADLGSTNGTWVDGSRLGPEPVTLTGASRLVVGSSTLALRAPAALPAAVQPGGAGQVAVNRSPRILPSVHAREIRLPAKPERREGPRLQMVAMILPLALSVVMAALLDSATYLLFGLTSPVMMLGSWFSDRRGGKHGHARRVADYQGELAAAHRLVGDALREEGIRRRVRQPDNAFLMTTAAGPHARLWERRRHDDDVLHLRVGSSRLPSSVTVRDPDADAASATPDIDDVPVCVPLPDVGVLGLAGPRDQAIGLARALLGQVCGWHSPRDVAVHILAADPELAADWTWAAYLPHTRPGRQGGCRSLVGILTADGQQLQRRVAHLCSLVEARKALRDNASGPRGWRGERTVVLLDGAQRLRAVPGVSQLMEDGPGVGVYFICIDTDAARLPVETHGTVHVVQVAGTTTLRVELAGAPVVEQVVADLVSRRWVERFARLLAPLRDATPDEDGGRLPEHARLLDVLDFDATDAAVVADRWIGDPRTTRAVIGVSATGAYAVDLSHDGPHALVGGTTGAGKSELLQTLIASLALGNRPDQLGFVLIDYKGGSAFKDCARLPHTVGLVTDLDGHLTRRALTSLEAELTRRERILKALGAKDIEDYHAVAGPADPPLARLVLVIDEFKMLVEDLPGFVDGLVKIAAVGRSLGVHLILATQRPGGIVSSDIRANVNLRVALRVRDRADSDDVLEAADAASIAEATPGRAYLRSGSSPLVMLQTARVAGHDDEAGDDQIRIRVLSWATAGDPQPGARPPDRVAGSTDLQRVVEATRQAAVALGIPAGPSPWLPPLPDVVSTAPAGATGWAVPYGLADLPEDQAQHALTWDLERDGHLAFAGTSRTGRTTALRTLAGAIAGRLSPADVHIYGFDGSAGGLTPLTALPHTGAVVTRDQLARADRLVQRLQHEVTRRQTWLSERGLSCLAEQRALANGEESPLPYLVLLIDGWDGLSAALETVDHGRPLDTLLQILREGAACGVRAAVTGDRSVLLSRIASVIPDKLVLRMADTTDLLMAGIPSRSLPVHLPAGRALRASDGAEIQLGLLTEDTGGPAQVAALAEIGRAAHTTHRRVPPERRPFRVDALPGRVTAGQLAMRPPGLRRSPTWALVGVGGDDLSPVGIDLAERGGTALVAGPPGSGRSTTLATMARSLADAGRAVVLVTARRSPLRDLTGAPGVVGCCTGADGELLRDLLARHRGLVAFADDAELLLDSPAEEVLVEMARHVEDSGAAVVCAGTTSELAGLYRGVIVEVRKNQSGVLLNPSGYADGEVFGIRVNKADDPRPGRGLLVDRSSVTPIQAALPQ